MSYPKKVAAAVAGLLALGVAMTPQKALAQVPAACGQVPPPQQLASTRPIQLGISGGNIRSILKNKKGRVDGCFSGTLGSMVLDSSNNQYILSNNHVLADQNKAKPGQLIVQPGLVDVECLQGPNNAVATFSSTVKLKFGGGKNMVDAAIAAVEPGMVSPQIKFIGNIASTTATPTLGMSVQKMGRTTCLTFGVIAGLDTNATINYSDNIKKPKLAKFVNQVVVTGVPLTPKFGLAGDSGSLIVTQGSCPQAVALLFAGSTSGLVIANPISSVLTGLNVSMAGSCSVSSSDPPANVTAESLGLTADAVNSAKGVRDRNEDSLMSIPGAVGTAIGSDDQPGEAAIEVFVKKMTPEAESSMPSDVEGVPVKLVESGEFVAY